MNEDVQGHPLFLLRNKHQKRWKQLWLEIRDSFLIEIENEMNRFSKSKLVWLIWIVLLAIIVWLDTTFGY